jgi:hypothetical protein
VKFDGHVRRKVLTPVLCLGLVALLIGIYANSRKPASPHGQSGSAFATNGVGVAAFADLGKRFNHQVSKRQYDLGEKVALQPDATLVVFDSVLVASDIDAVEQFVRGGGRLVAGGREDWINQLWSRLGGGTLETGLDLSDGSQSPQLVPISVEPPQTSFPESPASEFDTSAKTVAVHPFETFFAISQGQQTTPIFTAVKSQQAALVQGLASGAGAMFVVRNSSLFSNALLDQADNAALAIDLLGKPGRSVVFAEAAHGYRIGKNPASGLPSDWKWFLWGLVFAVVLWMISVGRRNGPPERPDRELPPARRDYVEALSIGLTRSLKSQRTNKKRSKSQQSPGPETTPSPNTIERPHSHV